MKLPPLKKIQESSDSPSWWSGAVGVLNNFFDNIYLLLSNNVEYDINIKTQTIELDFQTTANYSSGSVDDWTPVTFTRTLPSRAVGCELLQIYPSDTSNYVPITDPVYVSWIDVNGTIILNYITGLEDSTNYTIRLRVS